VDSNASENSTSFKANQSNQGPKASLDEFVWKTGICADYSGLSVEQQTSFADLLEEYWDLFATGDGELGRTHLIEHTIDTGSATSIKQAPRRLPPLKKDEIDRQLSELMTIEPSNSPWSSPIVLGRKHDGSYHLRIDYRRFNAVTVKDAQPLPRTDDIPESLGGAKWFSCLELASG